MLCRDQHLKAIPPLSVAERVLSTSKHKAVVVLQTQQALITDIPCGAPVSRSHQLRPQKIPSPVPFNITSALLVSLDRANQSDRGVVSEISVAVGIPRAGPPWPPRRMRCLPFGPTWTGEDTPSLLASKLLRTDTQRFIISFVEHWR